MPQADVDIVNIALTMLGEQRVLSIFPPANTKASKSANAIYAFERDNELRAHRWRFSITRVQLPSLTTPPPFGYSVAYQLPADLLAVIEAGPVQPGTWRMPLGMVTDGADYAIEGSQILFSYSYLPSNTPPNPTPLNLRYVKRVENANAFDSCFVVALACRLAVALAEDLTQDAAKKLAAQKDYQQALITAIRANAMEQPPDPLPDNSWLLSRLPG
jgi:hypothetical protein